MFPNCKFLFQISQDRPDTLTSQLTCAVLWLEQEPTCIRTLLLNAVPPPAFLTSPSTLHPPPSSLHPPSPSTLSLPTPLNTPLKSPDPTPTVEYQAINASAQCGAVHHAASTAASRVLTKAFYATLPLVCPPCLRNLLASYVLVAFQPPQSHPAQRESRNLTQRKRLIESLHHHCRV